MADERNDSGKFVKGVSGNPSGRSKSTKLTAADRKKLVKIIEDNITDAGFLKEMLSFLTEKAESVADVFKYVKEFAPYLLPKLSSIKSEVSEVKEIKIRIEGFDINPMKVLESDKTKTIEVNDE